MSDHKTREPSAAFKAHAPDFVLNTKKGRRLVDQGAAEDEQPKRKQSRWYHPDQPSDDSKAEAGAVSKGLIDTQPTPKQHPADTETTPSRHPNDTSAGLASDPESSVVALTGSESISSQHPADTQTTPSRHPNDTSPGLPSDPESSVVALAGSESISSQHPDDTEPTPKQHPNDTKLSIWSVTGLRRSVLFGLFVFVRERGGSTNIVGLTYDEIALMSAVKPASVRTTMKRLRDDGWIHIGAKRGNNRTINVDVTLSYQLFIESGVGNLP
jgi:hypothetical protein